MMIGDALRSAVKRITVYALSAAASLSAMVLA